VEESTESIIGHMAQPEAEDASIPRASWPPLEEVGDLVIDRGRGGAESLSVDRQHLGAPIENGQRTSTPREALRPIARPGRELDDIAIERNGVECLRRDLNLRAPLGIDGLTTIVLADTRIRVIELGGTRRVVPPLLIEMPRPRHKHSIL
jgi:hypothetical protein